MMEPKDWVELETLVRFSSRRSFTITYPGNQGVPHMTRRQARTNETMNGIMPCLYGNTCVRFVKLFFRVELLWIFVMVGELHPGPQVIVFRYRGSRILRLCVIVRS